MHIGEEIKEILVRNGLQSKDGLNFKGHLFIPSRAGQMNPSGMFKVELNISENLRWLEAIDGWGNIIKDVDLRNFELAQDAIDAVLN